MLKKYEAIHVTECQNRREKRLLVELQRIHDQDVALFFFFFLSIRRAQNAVVQMITGKLLIVNQVNIKDSTRT